MTKFETFIQDQAINLVQSPVWRDTVPDALGLVDKWLLDMREMARRSELGAEHCCRVFDLDSWWQTLLDVQYLRPQILQVIEVLTYSQNKDFNRALSKYKIVEVLEMCSS
jgi:hypothetical protein